MIYGRIVGLCTGILFCISQAFAQEYTVSRGIPEFTDIKNECVVGTYGAFYNPFLFTGIAGGHHSVIRAQGTDPYTGGKLQLLPPGESGVVKLGNDLAGAEAESLTYHFYVDAEKSLLWVKFAVVFEDSREPREVLPRFIVQVLNTAGEKIDSCCGYMVSSGDGNLNYGYYHGVAVGWSGWSDLVFDMSKYAGREVQVRFINSDCACKRHFGYTYFTSACISNRLGLQMCDGKKFTLSAPEGFSSYQWNNGARTASVDGWTDRDSAHFYCRMASVSGCTSISSAFMSKLEAVRIQGNQVLDSICEGEGFARRNFRLPAQDKVGTFVYQNTWFDMNTCEENATDVLTLCVRQRYYPIEAMICEGEDYSGNGFYFRHPPVGVHYDTLIYSFKERCDSVVVLKLMVAASLEMPHHIEGNVTPCRGSDEIYTVSNIEGMNYFHWEFPEGFQILKGRVTKRVLVRITDQAAEGPVIVYGENGCGEIRTTLNLTLRPAYWPIVTDTVCEGEEFHRFGFHLPAQRVPGYNNFFRYHKTLLGCDSVVSLRLLVNPVPKVQIGTIDSVLCESKEIGLNAVFTTDTRTIAVGDILCTDGTIVKPELYPGSNKTANGIVFYLDNTAKHGWAVHLHNQCDSCAWIREESIEYPVVATFLTSVEAHTDTMGHQNTKVVWEYGDRKDYPAVGGIDFKRGWYLPACGQLSILFCNILQINRSLALVKGTLINIEEDGNIFWSSTSGDKKMLWARPFSEMLNLHLTPSFQRCRVRSIINF